MEKQALRVPVERLRCLGPSDLDFESVSDIRPLEDFIGQGRAIEALSLGLKVRTPGFNIFVAGIPGSGKDSVIRRHLKKFVEEHRGEFKIHDYCYVYNFNDSAKPVLLILERGGGQKFKRQLKDVFTKAKEKISAFFGGEAYARKMAEIEEFIDSKREKLIAALKEEARSLGLVFVIAPNGNWLWGPPSSSDPEKIMHKDKFNALPEEQKEAFNSKLSHFRRSASKCVKEIEGLGVNEIKSMEKKEVTLLLRNIFSHINYATDAKIKTYIAGLKNFLLENFNSLKPAETRAQNGSPLGLVMGQLGRQSSDGETDLFLPFNVNVIVDNSKTAAPVVIESNPIFSNLIGKIDRKAVGGVYFTDHTMIRGGSIVRANGGFLVLYMHELLSSPGGIYTWNKLKSVLKTGLTIEDFAEYAGFFAAGTLKPEAVPLDVKVIIIGDPLLYHLLTVYDEDFLKLFRVKAEFESEVNADRNNFKAYAGFIALCCQREKLLPFDKSGMTQAVQYGIRLTDSQKKISTRFGLIKELLIEADYFAKESGSSIVNAEHVKKAITAKRRRVNLIEDKMQEKVGDGTIIIDTHGEKAAQVNGLAVISDGDFSFGIPMCITAASFCGKEGLVNIKRKVKMSGQIFEQADEIIAGYLGSKYAQNFPLALSITLAFEQSYGAIEGDSASLAELLAILSSLSGLEVNQGIAVTGSMRQNGLAQPVGGVGDKIEGWFKVCENKGLTGDQGVIIPHQNLDNLVFNEEVMKAIENDLFHIYSVKNIDEVIFLAFGKEPANVHNLVQKKIESFYKKVKPVLSRKKISC